MRAQMPVLLLENVIKVKIQKVISNYVFILIWIKKSVRSICSVSPVQARAR